MAEARATPVRRVRDRERDLVQATRRLFDERGMQHAPIEEIARAVGIARGLVYRHFSSKEELFVLTVTDYLTELDGVLAEAIEGEDDPVRGLECCAQAYASFCERYPAFLDSSLSLMQRPARELYDLVSESVYQRLGAGMASCIEHLAGILRAGAEGGTFPAVDDPDYLANVLWTQTLGAMHLARIRVGVRTSGGTPGLFRVDPDDIVRSCVQSALAMVGAPQPLRADE